jgi:hypothetical protein
MESVVFVMGLVLFVLGSLLAPMSRDDRPGLLKYLPEDASKKLEGRFRLINSALWLVCLIVGLALMSFGFLS